MDHLLRNDLLANSQHGFMPNKSCCTNLLEFFEKVTSVVDQGSPFDVIFLDFAKAFDKVPKERLLEKLRALWVRAWLTDRKQRVVLYGECSSWRRFCQVCHSEACWARHSSQFSSMTWIKSDIH